MSFSFKHYGGKKLALASVISALVLSGCGGSGGSDSDGGGSDSPAQPENPTPTLSVKGAVIAERNANHKLVLPVSLSGPADENVSFTWETVNDTAKAGSDFVAAKRFVTIPAGEKSASIEVDILGDTSFEPDESFKIRLSNPDGVEIAGGAMEVSVALLNEDSEPLVYFTEELQRVEENRVNAQVTIALSEVSGFNTEVTLGTAGTALEEQDFQLMAGKNFVIPAGQKFAEYPVNVVEDQVTEYGETLVLTMSGPVNAKLPEDGDSSRFKEHTLVITGEAGMNDTGVTTFSDGAGNVGLASEPASAPGQDASHGRDVENPYSGDGAAGFSFTKIDAHGNELADSATNWSCVRDNVTGLVWEVKRPVVDPPSVDQNLRDWTATNYLYTWLNRDSSNNGGEAGSAGNSVYKDACKFRTDGSVAGEGCNTAAYLKEKNNFGHCGFKNWRLPDIHELKSIHKMSSSSSVSAPDTAYFPNTFVEPGVGYLSSTPSSDNSASVWCFEVATGQVRLCQKQIGNTVRLVRNEVSVSEDLPAPGDE